MSHDDDLPPALAAELARWNDGAGIALDAWIACVGSPDLALGYATAFWPRIDLYRGYLLQDGWTPETVRAFEARPGATPAGVEWVMNHRHVQDLHSGDSGTLTREHCLRLGTVLREITAAKLAWQYPDRPCEVAFHVPDDPDDLIGYQVSFRQWKWTAAPDAS